MNTVAGLTGIGLVSFVLFTSGVTVRAPSAELQRIQQRRETTRRWAEIYGLDVRELEADSTFHFMLGSRAGPQRHLAELQKKKAAAVAKQD